MASVSLCVSCSGVVSARMHALCCDRCDRWQHRKCETGVSSSDYKRMTRGDLTMTWNCKDCHTNVANSTAADGMLPPALDASTILHSPVQSPVQSPVHSPAPHEGTFVTWSSAMPQLALPVIPHADPDIDMEFIDASEVRSVVQMEDVTFDLPDRDFVHPDPVIERSLADPVLDDDIPEDTAETFEEVVNGSKRGGRKLLSSKGYTYTVKRTSGDRVFWACSVRGKKLTCHATVKQYRSMYTPGLNGHIHPADPGASLKVKVSTKVKQLARDNVFLPAAAIVEQTLADMVTPSSHSLPNTDHLTRAANLHREKLRPKDPTDLSFELDEAFIGEDFLVDDIRVDAARHVIFATPDQLNLLRDSKRWFIDGTFKIVRRPFYQLVTIHAFVRKGDDIKQVPLLYCLMSRRSKQDYLAVFRSVKARIPGHLVEWIMLDYESATWQALREVFPGTVQKGCVFHWSQRVYRKISESGLATAYMEKGDKYRYFKKLLSLPFLPAEHITAAFTTLEQQATEVGGAIHATC